MILRASPSPSLSISTALFQSPTLLIPNLKTQFRYKYRRLAKSVLLKTKSSVEQDLDGLPPEFYDDRIEEAAEKGELNELVLMVIWNRLDLARRDEEMDAIRALDLLYRRVEHEGQLKLPSEADDVLLRVDFVREVDALLQEVRSE
ncbi:hypothetical protein Scep_027648 [Stephania cephalantha]|uniref:Uncharacterized protein n=1 Tax=Stephania cephalantha TaxID=152367 RepID=A0AAP0E8F0_9MAGN